MDRQQMEHCLGRVTAYRASGQKAKAWAEANDVPMRSLASWCGHSRRWQARLEGVSTEPSTTTMSSGFVVAPVGSNAATSTSIRVELKAGTVEFELHWPLAHTRELAALLRELGR